MNNSIGIFGYDEPNCMVPSEPFCVVMKDCTDWELQDYKSNLESWVMCRKDYIQNAQDDADFVLLMIKEGIDQVIEGN